MPLEGHSHQQQHQHVYGAKHPPLTGSALAAASSSAMSASGGGGSGGGASGSSTSGGGGKLTSSFKDFERTTENVWDLDESERDDDDIGADNIMTSIGPKYSFRISIPDSEKVARNIIKNHQESQERLSHLKISSESPTKLTDSKTLHAQLSPSSMKPPFVNGPGKALRQDQYTHTSSIGGGGGLLSTRASVSSEQSPSSSMSTSQQQQQQQQHQVNSTSTAAVAAAAAAAPRISSAVVSLQNVKSGASGSSSKLDITSSVLLHTEAVASGGPNGPGATAASGGGGGATSRFATTTGVAASFISTMDKEEMARCEKFEKILANNPVNLDELQKASWKGIPRSYRPICWKLLSDYLPLKLELQEKTIEQKRNAYWESVNEHYSSAYLDSHHEMLRQILNDIPRMNPLIPIFQKKIVQNIFQRTLYVWAVRHPASGYVQGINDLLTPFFAVFLTEYSDANTDIQSIDIENMSEKHLRQLEADAYWCMTKLLERIQENYVFSQPGIQKNIQSLEDLIKRIDNTLYLHLKRNNIEFIQFAFRWMNNLLMREIPLDCTIRLWDTYHAEPFGFSDFHLYVCAAFLLRFSKNLLEEKDFQGLMLLLQNLPTRSLRASDVSLLTAEAYKLQVMFADSPNHTART